jgi:cbb3-type cytochrome oxidase maturation protein
VSGLLLLIPVALALGLGGLIAFLWALRSGQFDDLEGTAARILFDDEPLPPVKPLPGNPATDKQCRP